MISGTGMSVSAFSQKSARSFQNSRFASGDSVGAYTPRIVITLFLYQGILTRIALPWIGYHTCTPSTLVILQFRTMAIPLAAGLSGYGELKSLRRLPIWLSFISSAWRT